MGGVNNIFDLLNKDLHKFSNGRQKSYIYAQQKREILKRAENTKDNKTVFNLASSKSYEEIEEYINKHPELAKVQVRTKDNKKVGLREFFQTMEENKEVSDVSQFIADSINNIVFWFSRLALSVLLLVRTFVLSILYLLGPLAIGFSLIPGFEGSLVHWLQKYIHVSLWCVVAFVLELVLHTIGKIDYLSFANGDYAGVSDVAEGIGVVAILGYFMVPSMAMWLVQGAITNFAGKILSAGKKIAGVIGGVATGGTTTAATTGTMLSEVGKNVGKEVMNKAPETFNDGGGEQQVR